MQVVIAGQTLTQMKSNLIISYHLNVFTVSSINWISHYRFVILVQSLVILIKKKSWRSIFQDSYLAIVR